MILGEKYDRICDIYHADMEGSQYGLHALDRALKLAGDHDAHQRTALDVGCGVGGRMIHRLQQAGFDVVGVDASQNMMRLAQSTHPDCEFHHADFLNWETDQTFDFILAWDSIFHLPLEQQKPVLTKFTQLLNDDGILLYTFGDAHGFHESSWHDDTFYYSSLGINGNLTHLIDHGLKILHLDLDQYPQKHVFVIAQKAQDKFNEE